MNKPPPMPREDHAREWIPVDQGRPDTDRACLVTDGRRQYVATFHRLLGNGGGWGYIVYSTYNRTLHVIEGATHWMELPDIPPNQHHNRQ